MPMRIDPLILFKMLVLQQFFNLSDQGLEFHVNDRRSFEEFVGLGLHDATVDLNRKHCLMATPGLISQF